MERNSRSRKGFTLIELLVVVAIISLLSSIVFASLTSARSKAKDAAIKEGVSQFETLLALNYNDYGNYCNLQYGWITASGKTCSDPTLFSGAYAQKAQDICNNIYNNASDKYASPPGNYKIYANTSAGCTTSYAFLVYLNDGKWFCSSSSGIKGEYANLSNSNCAPLIPIIEEEPLPF